MFLSLDAIFSKNPPNFNVDSFSWQNSFDLLILLWFIKIAVAFSFFLNIYDLKTVKLP